MSETTTHELRAQLRSGWLGSIALHGFLFLGFLQLFHQSLMTVPEEPFHWDVMLVESTRTADEPVQPVAAVESAAASLPKSAPGPARAVRTIRHAALSAERIDSLVPKTNRPVTPKSIPESPSLVMSPKESAPASTPDEFPPAPAQATEPFSQQTAAPIDSTTQVPPRPEATAAVTSEGSTTASESAQSLPTPAATLDTAVVSAIRPDYAWLQQAIFLRLEELKRSSRPSLDDPRPLKVLVKAVVSREGALLDSTVVKSSGLDRIDQEAMALVRRAFPMRLDRPLDRPQVAMRIPIAYSRE